MEKSVGVRGAYLLFSKDEEILSMNHGIKILV